MILWPSLIHKKHWDKWVHELGTGCHLWVGYAAGSTGKRPVLTVNYSPRFVTRLICAEVYGPSKLDACHVPPCKNYMCINPDHLYWGTQVDNEADKNRGITRYVRYRGDGLFEVRVNLKQGRKYVGIYRSLDEAVLARDVFMEQHNADLLD